MKPQGPVPGRRASLTGPPVHEHVCAVGASSYRWQQAQTSLRGGWRREAALVLLRTMRRQSSLPRGGTRPWLLRAAAPPSRAGATHEAARVSCWIPSSATGSLISFSSRSRPLSRVRGPILGTARIHLHNQWSHHVSAYLNRRLYCDFNRGSPSRPPRHGTLRLTWQVLQTNFLGATSEQLSVSGEQP